MPIRTRIQGFSAAAFAMSITGVASASGQTSPVAVAIAVGCEAPCPSVPAELDEHRSFGFRVSETNLHLEDRTTTAFGALFALNHHQYATLAGLTSRLHEFAFIGGGSGDFEGGLGGDLAFGWRAVLGEHHGPFGRLGLRGELLGNDVFYRSTLELPVGELGYQLLRDRSLLIEVALDAAPVLVGRYNVEGARARALGGSFAWGGHLALALDAIHLEAGYSRLEPKHDSAYGALDTLNAALCGGAGFVAVCGDLRFVRGDVHALVEDAIVPARTFYLGAFVGLSSASPRRQTAQPRAQKR